MKKITLGLCAVSVAGLSACTDPAYMTGSQAERDEYLQTKTGAVIGGILGAGVAAATDGNVLVGAAVGAGAGAIIGNQLDKQEAELRRDLGNDVIIENTGDRLIVTLPQDLLFAVDSFDVRADLRSDLANVATSLNKYPDTTVQVLGHTDNTGAASYNQTLSERRAGAVSSILIQNGVSASRVQTIGRGEDQSVASNLSPEGRAQNRRVEIVILPNA